MVRYIRLVETRVLVSKVEDEFDFGAYASLDQDVLDDAGVSRAEAGTLEGALKIDRHDLTEGLIDLSDLSEYTPDGKPDYKMEIIDG